MRRLYHGAGLAPAGILLLTVATGCTHQGTGKPATPSAAKTPDTPASLTPGQSALDAYQGMWHAYLRAVAVPDPTDPDLARYATGQALSTLTSGVQSVKDQGLRGTGDISTSPTVTSAPSAGIATAVQITDCLDTSGSHIIRSSPGSAYSDPPGGHRRTVATVRQQQDGSWKVENFAVQAVGTCD